MRWLYLKPWDLGVHWCEAECQSYCMARLKGLRGYGLWWSAAADMNGLADTEEKRINAGRLGLMPGETDLRLYFRRGLVVLVELKMKDNDLSPDQVKRHKLLKRLGFKVHTVYAATPWDCWQQIERIINQHARLPWLPFLW